MNRGRRVRVVRRRRLLIPPLDDLIRLRSQTTLAELIPMSTSTPTVILCGSTRQTRTPARRTRRAYIGSRRSNQVCIGRRCLRWTTKSILIHSLQPIEAKSSSAPLPLLVSLSTLPLYLFPQSSQPYYQCITLLFVHILTIPLLPFEVGGRERESYKVFAGYTCERVSLF
jgi:hypothetical protein